MIEQERPIRLGPINIPLDVLLTLMVAIGGMFAFSFWIGGGFAPADGGRLTSLGQMNGLALWACGADGPLALYENGEWWRLFAAIFLHGGIMHLAMNCWTLHVIGKISVALYGPTRTLFTFLATGLIASFASATWMYFKGGTISVGASGAILGLVGFVLGHLWKRQDAAAVHYRRQLIQWSLMILVFGLIVPRIDNAGHIGGFIPGFVLGRIVRPASVDINGVEGPVIRSATLVLVLITLVALGLAIAKAKDRYEHVEQTSVTAEFLRTAYNGLLGAGASTELTSASQLSRNGLAKSTPDRELPKELRDEALEILDSSMLNVMKVQRLRVLLDRADEGLSAMLPDFQQSR